jgi:hypothetical protein
VARFVIPVLFEVDSETGETSLVRTMENRLERKATQSYEYIPLFRLEPEPADSVGAYVDQLETAVCTVMQNEEAEDDGSV